MTFYQNMQQTALSLISQFGQQVTIRSKQQDFYDPITAEPLAQPQQAAQIAQGVSRPLKSAYSPDSVIKYSDTEIVLAAKGISKPHKSDVVTINNTDYQVVEVAETNPASTALVYFLHVRA